VTPRRLELEPNVWLATARPDGRPHLVPIWFVWVNGSFWLATGEDSVKVTNVRANPEVVVALEDGNRPVVAEGTAMIRPRAFPVPVVAAFERKFDWDISVASDADVGRVALIEVAVVRWIQGGPDA
jgi:predicted pyridoxine 5'-phosphate oxidase superfamily flavin-nucleotide-binding protein